MMMTKMINAGLPASVCLALAAILSVGGAKDVQACSDSPYIGGVCYMLGNFCPDGYVQATGQLLLIDANQILYSILGVTYGGDGKSTFALPDLRGRSLVGYGQGKGLPTDVALGTVRGQEGITLAANQVPVPPHSHSATFTGTGGGSATVGQASGTVSLPVVVTVPSQNVSVSGSLKIANNLATGAVTFTDNAVLARGGRGASIYAPASTTATNVIGPNQTFSGSLPTQTINTTASGAITLPVTGGGGGITGGTVAVAPNDLVNAAVATPTLSPQLAVTGCVATAGSYPSRQ
ncbi:MAG: tail fiber protein [Alphaproteobacteria bacterium]|nr:tail fiber protein [Alphaproteobacteria bacterium]